MNKLIKTLSILAVGLSFLTGCSGTKNVKSYYLDSNNNLIVVYEDSTETNLGSWGSDIIGSLGTVTISSDGYYVINGVKTDIKAKVPASYSIDTNGHLIVTYTDGTHEDLGDLSESLVNGVQTIEISEDGYYVINGIETNIKAIEVFTVSFDTGFSKTIEPQKVKDGYKVIRPEIDRSGYTLNGWSCNGEEWRFNSDVVKNNMTLKAEWTANTYTVSFVNEKGVSPQSMNVTYDSYVTLPDVSADGYTFAGWFNGSTKVTNGKWAIASNVTLTAKWTTNEYTITLNPGEGSVSKNTVFVKYNEPYTLPIPTNSYGVFSGWLLNGEKVTDEYGKSLSNWAYTENKTFTVDWSIKIYNATDLVKLNTFKNGSFKLMNDIDMTGVKWTPVGTSSEPFIGKLDGVNHSIINLSINTSDFSDLDAFGLFGYVNTPCIDNLKMVNFTFTSSNIEKSYYVGSIIGRSLESQAGVTMSRCISSGTFNIAKQSASYPIYAGGIAGAHNSPEAFYCANYGDISASIYAGGIISNSIDGDLTYLHYCGNYGDISASISGGIIANGSQTTNISQCFNKGNVTGTSTNPHGGSGGVIGNAYVYTSGLPYLTINNCYNIGNVSGAYIGGIVGTSFEIEITNCYNIGTISGSYYSSPVYGYSSKSKEMQCLGSGTLTGNIKNTIGWCGSVTSTDCYYTFSNIDDFSCKTGTYVSSSEITNKTLYVDNMFWSEYNPTTGKGEWVFVADKMPSLHIEELLYVI